MQIRIVFMTAALILIAGLDGSSQQPLESGINDKVLGLVIVGENDVNKRTPRAVSVVPIVEKSTGDKSEPQASSAPESVANHVADNPTAEEIAMKTAERLSKAIVHRHPCDLRTDPIQRESVTRQTSSRSELFFEGFESGVVPPSGWTAIVNNDFTWEPNSFSPYEGAYQASCFYDEYYTGFQNEWLISPIIDLTSEGAPWKLDFWWKGSYYFSVSPYNSCDLIVMISTDGGTLWDTLWTEHEAGEFTSWRWYNAVIELDGYLSESNVKLAFQYIGFDGAEFSIDAVLIHDGGPVVGRCCYGDPEAPSCDDTTETECTALGGTWERYRNCAEHPCPIYYPPPPNDEWTNAELIPGPFPATVTGTTQGATLDCPGPSYWWNMVWYVFEVPYELNDVDVDYCGSVPGLDNAASILFSDPVVCEDPISREDYEWHDCGDGETNPHLWWTSLPGPATYYLPIYTGNDERQRPFQFTISLSETEPPETGNYCGDPITFDIGLADLPYILTNQSNCGRDDWYHNTCLDDYDRGEDIIYQLNLLEDLDLSITLDPKGTAYSGFLIDDACPPDTTTCIATSSQSEGDPHGIDGVSLTAGTYYLMVDTWASPDCIPDFDLTFEYYQQTSGDDCTDPLVVKLPDDMIDGPDNNAYIDENQTNCGRGNNYEQTCLDNWDKGEDIIYMLDVSETVTVDILLDPGPTNWSGILIDDNCPPDETDCIQYSTANTGAHGLYELTLNPGCYYIMVDTYASPDCIPSFTLTIQPVASSPENDNCEDVTPVLLADGVPVAFTGDNTNATHQCDLFEGAHVWHAFTLDTGMNVTLDYCTTNPAFNNAWLCLAIGCPCSGITSSGEYDGDICGDNNLTISWNALESGTYYYPVLTEEGSEGPYTIHVIGEVVGGCCIPPLRGNVNFDVGDAVNIADLTYLVAHLFGGGAAPPCFEEADVNCDGSINIADLTYLVAYLFGEGAVPCQCDCSDCP